MSEAETPFGVAIARLAAAAVLDPGFAELREQLTGKRIGWPRGLAELWTASGLTAVHEARPSIPFAYSSFADTVTEADIIATAAQSMAGYKVPAHVWFVDVFPVTPSANATKIQRGKLRDMALANLRDHPP